MLAPTILLLVGALLIPESAQTYGNHTEIVYSGSVLIDQRCEVIMAPTVAESSVKNCTQPIETSTSARVSHIVSLVVLDLMFAIILCIIWVVVFIFYGYALFVLIKKLWTFSGEILSKLMSEILGKSPL